MNVLISRKSKSGIQYIYRISLRKKEQEFQEKLCRSLPCFSTYLGQTVRAVCVYCLSLNYSFLCAHFNPLCVCSGGGEVSNAQFVGFQGHRLYIFVMQHWIKARIKRRQCVHRFVRWYQTFSSFLSGSFVSSHLAYYGRHFFFALKIFAILTPRKVGKLLKFF